MSYLLALTVIPTNATYYIIYWEILFMILIGNFKFAFEFFYTQPIKETS